ncbi:MAG: LamG domain-containing protein [Polyangiales bacterium]
MFAGACEGEPCAGDACDDDTVQAYGTSEGSISSNAVLSANGTYGAGCALRAGQSWSVRFQPGAPLDSPSLEVAKGNIACALSLVSFRTGSGASELYAAASPLALSSSFSSALLFSSPSASLAATAKLSGNDFSGPFVLTLMVSEGATTADAGTGPRTRYAYEALVLADAPVSYWRFDDAAPTQFVSDDFTGSAGVTLQARSAAWLKHGSSGTDALISSANRVRNGAAQRAVYLSQTAPASADYVVSADVYIASLMQNDLAGVIARASPTLDTYYFAGLVQFNLLNLGLVQTRRFEVWKYVGGLYVVLFTSDELLSASTTRRVQLEVVGNTLFASLDGVQRAVLLDTSTTATGQAGIVVGALGADAQSNTTGTHLDNFSAQMTGRARDAKSVNHGSYVAGVSHVASGALTVPNGSASFNGTSNYIEVERQIGADFSIELWFKSTQGVGAASVTQWWQTAGLVDASATISVKDFGIGLRSDGKILAGTGSSSCFVPLTCGDQDVTIVSAGSTSYKDGNWHHVVFTRTRATGSLSLYIDGALSTTVASGGSTSVLDGLNNLTIGRIQRNTNFFAGQIDEVAVYASVLGAQTVLNHYQAGRF